ncbi:molybdopterin oxidoreductase family protein [Actinocorallia sp. A-T 12471]|uniref:molybdopterin oxidoreductase family protein n=1 Tax=Actinocorallia sp. A-T 12471 TaxID=3089813 RepID=UPI0029D3B164|nr:molybdopterin-dependent oxidoreductase [Actinocorallia sp. A-T 12471]MDX6739960.1 molybdopterin-dependent oxidoreductase [Actinocorallia sp. A-T 12471]
MTTPLLRVHPGAPLEPVSWDAALDVVAARLRAARGGSAAVFGGCGMTNEQAYQLGKFARVALRTPRVAFGDGPGLPAPAAAALTRAFGLDRAFPGPLTDVGEADALLLVGGDSAVAAPSFLRQVRRMREGGGALVVVDPRATEPARSADLHLQLTPGTESILANGLLFLAIADGLIDAAYVAARTSGFDRLRTAIGGYWPERVERLTGVPVARMREAVRLLAAGRRSLVVTERERGAQTVAAYLNLALALGLPGVEGSGFGCVADPDDGRGHGQKADRLPGDRSPDDVAAREHVARVWGVAPADLPVGGPPVDGLLGGPDAPRALLVFGSDPVAASARASVVEQRLSALDLLVVADHELSQTALRADVVLPVARWAEVSGTATNLEGLVLRRRRAVAPPEGVRTGLEVLRDLAARLGAPGEWSADPAEVFAELGRASAGGPADCAGMSYARLDAEDGVCWPCPSPEHPGTPRAFLESFATRDGRARFVAVDPQGPAEDVDARYPLYLTTSRNTGTPRPFRRARGAEGRVGDLRRPDSGPLDASSAQAMDTGWTAEDAPVVELHPDLAERLGVTQGAIVRVSGRRGVVIGRVRFCAALREDTVAMSAPWGGEGGQRPAPGAEGAPWSAVWAVRIEPVGLPDPVAPLMLDGP